MKHFSEVRCLDTPPKEIEIGVDTIFKRYNIQSFKNEENRDEFIYEEDQLTIDEYLRDVVPENQDLTETTLGELSILFANYQLQTDLAIAELSIAMEGFV